MEMNRLMGVRIESRKTQEEIAAVLSCSREVYRRYDKRIYELPLWALKKLADYYDISTDYIVGRVEDLSPYRKRLKGTK